MFVSIGGRPCILTKKYKLVRLCGPQQYITYTKYTNTKCIGKQKSLKVPVYISKNKNAKQSIDV